MKTKMIKWFAAFKCPVPAQYEEWFERLAEQGWHPEKLKHSSSVKMNFYKGDAKKYRYVVDLQPKPTKEYKQIYGDFGWEFVGQMSGIFVWRKEYTDKKPESFSDRYAADKRNKRFTTVLAVLAGVFTCVFLAVAVLFGLFFAQLNSAGQYIQFAAGLILSGLISFLLFSRLHKIVKYVNKSKNN